MKILVKSIISASLGLMLSTAAFAHGSGNEDCNGSDHAQEHGTVNETVVKAANLELSNARTRAMLSGQKVGGGYVDIKNTGTESDRLISVSSPVAGRMEVHEMTMDNGVMKMRKLDAGVAIAPGETLSLKPGGHHLMFFGIEKPFAEGDKVPVEFTFEKAGKVDLELLTAPAANAKDKKTH